MKATQSNASLPFDFDAHELVVNGQRIGLSHLEFNVLAYLSKRPGKAVPRDDLLDRLDMPMTAVWLMS